MPIMAHQGTAAALRVKIFMLRVTIINQQHQPLSQTVGNGAQPGLHRCVEFRHIAGTQITVTDPGTNTCCGLIDFTRLQLPGEAVRFTAHMKQLRTLPVPLETLNRHGIQHLVGQHDPTKTRSRKFINPADPVQQLRQLPGYGLLLPRLEIGAALQHQITIGQALHGLKPGQQIDSQLAATRAEFKNIATAQCLEYRRTGFCQATTEQR